MKKTIVVCLSAMLALSASAALAAKKSKAAAAAPAATSGSGLMNAPGNASDMKMMKQNQRDSGMKAK